MIKKKENLKEAKLTFRFSFFVIGNGCSIVVLIKNVSACNRASIFMQVQISYENKKSAVLNFPACKIPLLGRKPSSFHRE